MRRSTREEASTTDRVIGEKFLRQFSKNHTPVYSGYVVIEGTIAPQWTVGAITVDLAVLNENLKDAGYRAKIV